MTLAGKTSVIDGNLTASIFHCAMADTGGHRDLLIAVGKNRMVFGQVAGQHHIDTGVTLAIDTVFADCRYHIRGDLIHPLDVHTPGKIHFVAEPQLAVAVGVITTAGNRNAGQTVRGGEAYCLGWSVALVRLRVAAGVNGDPELKGCGTGHGKHNTDFFCIGKNMGFGTLQRLGEVDIVAAY